MLKKGSLIAWLAVLALFLSQASALAVQRDERAEALFTTSGRCYSTVINVGDTYYLTSTNASIVAVNSQGKLRWEERVKPAAYGLEYESGRLYAVSNNGIIYALDAMKGRELWNFEDPSQTSSGLMSEAISWPAISENRVFVTSPSVGVYALGKSSGKLLWRCDFAGQRLSPPLYDGGLVFVGADNVLYAIDAATGNIRWRSTSSSNIVTRPASDASNIYFAAESGAVMAVSKQSKSLVWLATVSGNAAGAVAVEGDRAYVYTDKGKLYSLKVGNGKIAWQADVSGYWMSPPAFDGNFIYVGSNDGKLYALDRESGVVLWSYDTGGDYVTSPAISGGRLVFTASFPGKDPSTQLIPLDKRLSAGAVDSAFKKEQLEKWLAATETLNGGTDVAAGAISAEYTGLASVNWPYGVPVKLLAVLGDQAGAGSAADIGFSAIFKVIAGSLFVVTVLVPMLFPIGGVFLLLFVWRSAGLLLFAKEGTGLAGAVQAARRPASLESIKGSYFRAVDAVLNDPLLLAPSLGAGILLLVYATVIGGAFGTGYTGVRIGTTALWLFGAALSAIVETMTFSLYQEVGDKAINRLADAFSNARRYFWRLFFCQVVLLGCLALGLLIVSYGILLDSSVAFALAFILWVLLALGSYADRFVLRGESAWRSLSESALWTIRNFKAVNRFTILTGLLAILVAFIASALNVLPYGLFATVILSAVGAVLLTILRADFFGVRREG